MYTDGIRRKKQQLSGETVMISGLIDTSSLN